jgi:hypothetical protein
MKHANYRQSFFWIIVMGLMLATAIPSTALAQGRGHGQGKGRGHIGNIGNIGNIGWPKRTTRRSNYDKKCAKFRNCHDASEGRWDGRGPRGNRVGNIFGTRVRHRNRRVDNDLVWRNRGRRVGRRVIDNR